MTNIVVPFDFSNEAEIGIELALQLSKVGDCVLQLVYVQRKQPDFGHLGLLDERRIAERELDAILERIQPRLASRVRAERVIRQGKVYREIVDQAEMYEDSLIVTSTHGASGFEEIFLGSNTLRMLASTTRPVFTIKHGVVPGDIRTILFPLDTTFESRQKAPYVARLAKDWNAEVRILAVMESANKAVRAKLQSYLAQVESYLDDRKVRHAAQTVQDADLVDLTLEQATRTPNSLIAITTRDKEAPRIFLVGNKPQRLISQSPVPVVAVAPVVEPIRDSFRATGS